MVIDLYYIQIIDFYVNFLTPHFLSFEIESN